MNQTVFTHNGFPKVGIRPIIDGRRRGVRESLEDQTMAMAKAAAKLISDNILLKKWFEHIAPTMKMTRENRPDAVPLRMVFHMD